MLHPDVIAAIADELAEADRTHGVIPRITARYPEATVEDSYAIQGVWRDKNIAAGRRLVGRKIGLTSKAMQQATGITRARLRRDVRRHRVRERRRHPGGPLLERAHRGRARVRAEGAARGAGLHARRRARARSTTPCPRSRCSTRTSSSRAARSSTRSPTTPPTARWCSATTRKRPDEIDLRWVPGAALPQRRDRGDRRRRGRARPPGDRRRVAREQVPPARRAPRGGRDHPRGIVHAPHVGLARRRRALRLRTDGRDHMPLRLNPTFRDALARRIPPARRHVGVLGQPARRRDLRRRGPGLGAHRHGALPQRPGVGARAAAGRRRVPGDAGRARADRRRRDDQAGARPRRAEHPRADGVVGRRGARRRRGGALPAARAARRRLGARALGPLEPRRRTTSPNADEHVSLFVQIETAEGSRPRPRSPRSTASTASSSGRPTSRRRWALLGQQTHPDVDRRRAARLRGRARRGQARRRERLRPRGRASATSTPARRSSLVGADVALLARGSEALAAALPSTADARPTSAPSY